MTDSKFKRHIDKDSTKVSVSKNSDSDHHCDGTFSATNINKSVPPPSAVFSTSSFKTASNDKVSAAIPDEEFIKFVDDSEKEGGKFYIGASGYLKNDNYEVVIQLRKKDGESQDKKLESGLESDNGLIKNTSNLSTKLKEKDQLEDKGNLSKSESQRERVHENVQLVSPVKLSSTGDDKSTKSHSIAEVNKSKGEQNKELLFEPTTNNETPNVCDKSVLTSFQESCINPDQLSRSEPTPRPATSTYTQTTFSSPMPRPVYMHMSSSTSTAYMSPPELILPRSLRQGCNSSNGDMYDSENSAIFQDKFLQRNQHNGVKSKQNETKKNVTKTDFVKKCKNKHKSCTMTPPNTARSQDLDEQPNKKSCKKTKCRKCISRSDTRLKYKPNNKELKQTFITKSFNEIQGDLESQSSKCKKSYLDPLVKAYINRLLNLKEEGLKAVEVINQDCSSVTTPGSSIINIASNIDGRKPISGKISLEQIKNVLANKILTDYHKCDGYKKINIISTENHSLPIRKKQSMASKKKTIHKIKSFNISRRLVKLNKSKNTRSSAFNYSKKKSSLAITKDVNNTDSIAVNARSKSLPTPRVEYNNILNFTNQSEPLNKHYAQESNNYNIQYHTSPTLNTSHKSKCCKQPKQFPLNRASTTSESDFNNLIPCEIGLSHIPINISTQTNGIIINNEINYMKIAEDKLQNMEKIADLTDKCTKRLSNLAKVLEQVRKNKSMAYSQISSSDSTPEQELKSDIVLTDKSYLNLDLETQTPDAILEENSVKPSTEFVPLLKDIPKPNLSKLSSETVHSTTEEKSYAKVPSGNSSDYIGMKHKVKPPPAMSRLNLKRGTDVFVIPHELSTVVEVDSPMSVKMKSQSSRHGFQESITLDTKNKSDKSISVKASGPTDNEPDLYVENILEFKRNISTSDSSDNSKFQMMDMKQFNDIMLKPFISLQDYAKQCDIGIYEGSNNDDVLKGDSRDELSSLHSDSSLPDIIGELLKRNIISEPFKFDSGSNNNSTALSSESTLSVLALSNAYKSKLLSDVFLKQKINAETSESMSMSSNPDLENAFQKLGMGWASSTLKKTKERLALTSSSSTSSSSMPRFKIKGVNHDLTTETNYSQLNPKKKVKEKVSNDNLKNAVQQTSLTNSMTVKEFLTNELSKKITFTNKSHSNEAEVEFISLYETKMPEEIKNNKIDEEQSNMSANSTNNRARTSTPVQIFKSSKYRSSSSSNTSNGLFSNADDLSSVKVTSNSIRNHSTSDKEDLTIPNYSLQVRKTSADSKSD